MRRSAGAPDTGSLVGRRSDRPIGPFPEEITWEEFFKKFEESKLALVYQEETASGERSNFNKLVSREQKQR